MREPLSAGLKTRIELWMLRIIRVGRGEILRTLDLTEHALKMPETDPAIDAALSYRLWLLS